MLVRFYTQTFLANWVKISTIRAYSYVCKTGPMVFGIGKLSVKRIKLGIFHQMPLETSQNPKI